MNDHPNKRPFEGVLALVDVPSDAAPCGTHGRRILLLREAVVAALPSLIGMGLNYSPDLESHDDRRVAGIITQASIVDIELRISGYIFGLQFPDLVRKLERHPETIGMSHESRNAHVDDMRASIWKIDELTFTGASVVLRSKAAYRQTSLVLQTTATIAASASAKQL
jgi:hypothetical protein